MVRVLEALIPKHVRVNSATLSLCLSTCSEVNSRESYQRVLDLTQGAVGDADLEKIQTKYPIPEEVVAEPEGDVESEGVEEEASEEK